MKKNGVFLFVISHLVPGIFKIFVLCKLGTDDVIRCDKTQNRELHHVDPHAKEIANLGCEKRILESKNRFCVLLILAKLKKGIMNPKYPHLRRIFQIRDPSVFLGRHGKKYIWRAVSL